MSPCLTPSIYVTAKTHYFRFPAFNALQVHVLRCHEDPGNQSSTKDNRAISYNAVKCKQLTHYFASPALLNVI